MQQHHILYIHGFNSSPKSYKAELTQAYLSQHFPYITYHCPQLEISPKNAMAQLCQLIELNKTAQWHIIGSSLGGYYANYLVEKYAVKAVLINPAVKPYELLKSYIGEQKNYHTNTISTVEPYFMNELKQLEANIILKKNYLVMVQTGDEVLDYQQAEQKYHQCQLIIEQGGDHSFMNFQNKLPEIMRFFALLALNLH